MVKIVNTREELENIILNMLRKLLCDKHLYQSVESSFKEIFPSYHEKNESDQDRIRLKSINNLLNTPWSVYCSRRQPIHNTGNSEVSINLPNIQTFCHCCKSREAFRAESSVVSSSRVFEAPIRQVFLVSFVCQKCSNANVDFTITRSGLKLTLSGRSPIETVVPPQYIPKGVRKYYSDAVIDYNTGAILEGLFMLRTLIEQFWKSSNLAVGIDRPTGDELGDAYNDTLKPSFKEEFPSLKMIYAELSKAIHEAREDRDLFKKSLEDIERHFDARRLFKL